jgi:hypothetical protein
VNKETDEGTATLKMKLPPEEAFESFAARLRPFTTGKESVYWAAVLDALEKPLSKETLAEIVDIDSLREHWKRVVEGSNVTQAYSVMTEKGQMTDVQLADVMKERGLRSSCPFRARMLGVFTLFTTKEAPCERIV